MLRWTKSSPGPSPVTSLAGIRLSAHPTHRNFGDCRSAWRSKNVGSLLFMSWAQARFLRISSCKFFMVDILEWVGNLKLEKGKVGAEKCSGRVPGCHRGKPRRWIGSSVAAYRPYLTCDYTNYCEISPKKGALVLKLLEFFFAYFFKNTTC